MTVYVDSARIPATVTGISARWSHMTADTHEELFLFAQSIGMKTEWFQTCKRKCGPDGKPCIHWHFDVTENRRIAAIRAGAKVITMRQMSELLSARRAAQREEL